MSNTNKTDGRYLFIDPDRIRNWNVGVFQRFAEPEKVALSGLEVGPPGSCDARRTQIYGSVLCEDGLFRMWYSVMPDALSHGESADHFYAAYAESDDGIHWRKPDLKITGQERFPGNNLLSLPGVLMGVVRALPGAPWNYLAAVVQRGQEEGISAEFGYEDNGHGTYMFVSDDGLHWRQLTPHPIAVYGDVACLFADTASNRYLLYHKMRMIHGFDMRRSFCCKMSADGLNWDGDKGTDSWRECFVCDDYDDLQAMQAGFRIADTYALALYRAGGTYISVESIFQMSNPLSAWCAPNPYGMHLFRLGFSHNAVNWHYPKGRPAWMKPGAPGEQDAGFAVPASTFLEHDDHLLLYYTGSRNYHGWNIDVEFRLRKDIAVEEYRGGSQIMLARVRKDRFGSLAATHKGTIAVEAARPAGADALFINASAQHGRIRVAFAMFNKQLEILPGFGFDDCIAFSGDETRAPVEFRNANLQDLPDGELMLHLEITRAEIFGFE